MIVSIHQPSYWPWLGLLDKIAKSNIFIILDNVDIKRQSYQYRNIFYNNGRRKLLTLPINKNHSIRLDELEFKNEFWRNDHLDFLAKYYKSAPYFSEIFPIIVEVYNKTYKSPVEFIINTVIESLRLFDIKTDIQRSSDYNCGKRKGELILNLSINAKANIYLSGLGAKKYLTNHIMDFELKNISIVWQYFSHPIYDQDKIHPFVEGLSCLDILFFNGIKESQRVFWENINKQKTKWFDCINQY